MPERIAWSEHEAALLLWVLQDVLNGNINRQDAIQKASKMLRTMALNQGKIIDDAYRNEAGITFQLYGLEGVWSSGKTPIGRKTAWMTSICDLYRKDPQRFNQLVQEAKEMSNASSKDGDFWMWLSSRNSDERLLRLRIGYHDLNTHGCNGKALSKPLDEIHDLFELQRIQSHLEYDVVFRFKYRRMLDPMREVLEEYVQYRLSMQQHSVEPKQNVEIQTQTIQTEKLAPVVVQEAMSRKETVPLQDEKNMPVPMMEIKSGDAIQTEPTEKQPTAYTNLEKKCHTKVVKKDNVVDFDSVTYDMYDTINPKSFEYFGEKTTVAFWQPLYIDICKKLADDYPSVFLAHDGSSIAGTKPELSTSTGIRQMAQPRSIYRMKNGEWFFAETHFRPSEILLRIKTLMDWCNVDYEHLVIECEVPKSSIQNDLPAPVNRHLKNIKNEPEQTWLPYNEWAKQSGFEIKEVEDDLWAFQKLTEIAEKEGLSNPTITEIRKLFVLNQIWSTVKSTCEWEAFTLEEKYIAKDAIGHYIQYCTNSGKPLSGRSVKKVSLGDHPSPEMAHTSQKLPVKKERLVESKLLSSEKADDGLLSGFSTVEQNTNVSLATQTSASAPSKESNEAKEKSQILDFSCIPDLSFTRPTSIELLGQEFKVHFWKDVYVLTIKELYKIYASKFDPIVGISKNSIELYLDTATNAYRMRSPKQVARSTYGKTLFAETNKNASSIANSLKKILDFCGCGYNLLTVRYEKNNEDEAALPEKRSIQSTQKWDAFKKEHQQRSDATPIIDDFSCEIVAKPVVVAPSAGANDTNGSLNEKQQRYAELLKEAFPDGFKAGSAIATKKMQLAYQNKYGEEPAESKEEIMTIVQRIGTLRDGRIYPKNQSQLLSEINSEILRLLNTEATCVYCDAVFEHYRERLAEEQHIYNSDALCDPLLDLAHGQYCARNGAFCLPDHEADISLDVLMCMRSHPVPATYNDLREELWYIPLDKIKRALMDDPAIVNVGDGTYFYAPNLPVSKEELRVISSQLESELGYHSYTTTAQLMRLIHEKCPTVEINTDGFSTLTIRNSLSYLLRKSFNFRSNIISSVTTQPPVDTKQAFSEFCREHETMTTAELQAFANEVDSIIYWDSVFSEMIRISECDWVRKDFIQWTPAEIDAKLDEMCEGDYLIMKDVCLFLQFPVVGYRWNNFLLESYVNSYSPTYTLLHASFSAHDCCGAVVKKSSPIKSYHDLAVDVLANDDAWKDQQSALQTLVDKGLQQRRTLSDIAQVTKEARLQREKRQREVH